MDDFAPPEFVAYLKIAKSFVYFLKVCVFLHLHHLLLHPIILNIFRLLLLLKSEIHHHHHLFLHPLLHPIITIFFNILLHLKRTHQNSNPKATTIIIFFFIPSSPSSSIFFFISKEPIKTHGRIYQNPSKTIITTIFNLLLLLQPIKTHHHHHLLLHSFITTIFFIFFFISKEPITTIFNFLQESMAEPKENHWLNPISP